MSNIEWVMGGYYTDHKGAIWCCFDVANAHGTSYRLIQVRDSEGKRINAVKPRWFEEEGWSVPRTLLSPLQIIRGPHKHPEENTDAT